MDPIEELTREKKKFSGWFRTELGFYKRSGRTNPNIFIEISITGLDLLLRMFIHALSFAIGLNLILGLLYALVIFGSGDIHFFSTILTIFMESWLLLLAALAIFGISALVLHRITQRLSYLVYKKLSPWQRFVS